MGNYDGDEFKIKKKSQKNTIQKYILKQKNQSKSTLSKYMGMKLKEKNLLYKEQKQKKKDIIQ